MFTKAAALCGEGFAEEDNERLEATTITANEKLESMESQLGDIKALLVAQQLRQEADEVKEKTHQKSAGETDTSTEDELFASIEAAVGYQSASTRESGGIPMKEFLLAFESLFLKGADMPAEVSRGLRILVDKDRSGKVTKLEWLKFWRQWQASGLILDLT